MVMLSREESKKILRFHEAAREALKDKYSAEFTCPVCGHTASAVKFKHNGHIWADCEGCGANVRQ